MAITCSLENRPNEPMRKDIPMTDQSHILQYYRQPGAITRIDKYHSFLDWLADDVRVIFQVVQGILIHDSWIEQYGGKIDWSHSYDTQTAYMEDLLDKALQLDPRSLALPRSLESRVVCCCREFATLLCAILRHKGIPARSRCGFGRYFSPDYYEDHWMCEYWDQGQGRWVQVDPQIDPFQQSTLQLDFSPLDMPAGRFTVAGEVWQKCRSGEVDPMRCGIPCDPKAFGLESLYGLWFVRGQLLRDFAALNKVETVPLLVRLGKGLSWRAWRLVGASDGELSPEDYELLDTIAGYSAWPDRHFEEIRSLYLSNPDLQVPESIICRDLYRR
ncbi:MAG: transglutaminase domain-containing protein [Chloroflexota bacterium]|nr:MAG: transglutaminase domain-containing protein [Chloroflexota bacterium]